MSHYFFHLRDGVDLVLDDEGRECDGVDAAAALALQDARSILSDEVTSGVVDLDKHIDVETADGVIVHRLDFEDAITIVRPPTGASS